MRTAILAFLLSGAILAQVQSEALIASLQKQIEINPENFSTHANLGKLYCELQRYPEAVAELEKAAAIKPEAQSNLINLGGAYLGTGQTEPGLAILDKVLQNNSSPANLNSVAYALASHKLQLERAQKYAEATVGTVATVLQDSNLDHLAPIMFRRVSELATLWDTLGWIHFQRGNLDEAARFLNAAWMLDQHGATGDHLGQLYERRSQKQEAIHAFAQAVAAWSVLPETRSRLAALVGDQDQVAPLVARARDELVAIRTFKAGKLVAEKASAVFYVRVVPAPGVPEIKFIRGDERLRLFTNDLKAVAPPGVFPDSSATMLVRSATLTCPGEGGECVFELLTANAAANASSPATAPIVLHKVGPAYSKEALKAKLEGTVVLYLEVTPEGLPSKIRVVRSLGKGLDEKAVEAVEQWRFQPGVKDGKLVTVAATIEVNFRLLKYPKGPR